MADQDVRANHRRPRHSLPRAVDGAGSISAPGSCPRARAAGKRGKHDQVNGLKGHLFGLERKRRKPSRLVRVYLFFLAWKQQTRHAMGCRFGCCRTARAQQMPLLLLIFHVLLYALGAIQCNQMDVCYP